ncbi:hypothetical protein G3I17_25485 [Streptomyces sp. SID13031]|nr:hypothetical protein [Streptomyces sp. SID13031]
MRSGGPHDHAAGGMVIEQPGGHLGAARVVDADDENLGKSGAPMNSES